MQETNVLSDSYSVMYEVTMGDIIIHSVMELDTSQIIEPNDELYNEIINELKQIERL